MRYVLLAIILLFAPPALAQSPLPEVSLTPSRVEMVLAAYDPMRARVEEISGEFESDGDAGDVAERLQALAMVGAATSALDGAARENGFAGYMDWLSSTYAVFMAHAFAQNPQLDAQMQQALDQVDSQPGLSDAQREQIKASIMQSMGALESMRPSEENLAAVAPYGDEIEAILAE